MSTWFEIESGSALLKSRLENREPCRTVDDGLASFYVQDVLHGLGYLPNSFGKVLHVDIPRRRLSSNTNLHKQGGALYCT